MADGTTVAIAAATPVNFDAIGPFEFAWSGDESQTVMHYLALSNGFGVFDRVGSRDVDRREREDTDEAEENGVDSVGHCVQQHVDAQGVAVRRKLIEEFRVLALPLPRVRHVGG